MYGTYNVLQKLQTILTISWDSLAQLFGPLICFCVCSSRFDLFLSLCFFMKFDLSNNQLQINWHILKRTIRKNTNLSLVECPKFYQNPLGYFYHVFISMLTSLPDSATVFYLETPRILHIVSGLFSFQQSIQSFGHASILL